MTYREKLNLVEGVNIGERLDLAKMLSDQHSESECKRLADYIRGPLLEVEDEFFEVPEQVERTKAKAILGLRSLQGPANSR